MQNPPPGRDMSPAALAGRPLFAPLAGLMGAFPSPGLPSCAELDALAAQQGLRTADGRRLSFTPPADDGLGYEARIAACGQVEHRPDNWHDYFNALVWLAFPAAKAALSARHGRALAERGGAPGRGLLRDALTQFDECGVAVLSADASFPELLRGHRWKEAFWQRRADLQARVRFVVFGHALFDQLRKPFFGLCGKARYLDVSADWLAWDGERQRADLDRRLADWLSSGLSTLRDLKPLPLLGIPGVVAENGHAAYYDDARQFRPLAAPRPVGVT